MSKKSNKKQPVNQTAKLNKGNTAKKPAANGKGAAPASNGDVKAQTLGTRAIALIVTGAILLAIVLTVGIVLIVDYVKNDKGFDYFESDLSKYLYIDEKEYKNYLLEVDVAEPREVDLEGAVLSFIAENKGDRLCGENQWLSSGKDLKVTPGSLVKLWFRGYRVGEDGKITELDGINNFSSTTPSVVDIGFLGYPPGFEVGLVGQPLSADRVMFSKITSGKVNESQVLYLTYQRTETSTSEKTKVTDQRLDLESDVDGKFGKGFKDTLLGMNIGDSKTFGITGADGVHYDYELTVSFATECEKEEGVLKIETYFPYTYPMEVLRNEDVVFDVYIEAIQPYEYEEYTDEFVLKMISEKKAGITEEELNEYEGTGAAEKYRSYLWENLNDGYKTAYDSLVEIEMWDRLFKVANIKKYPASQVNPIYEKDVQDIEDRYYASQGSILNSSTGQYQTYKTLDSYADAYLGMTSTANYSWRDKLMDDAKQIVAQKMILCYVMDVQNIVFTEQQKAEKEEELRTEYYDLFFDAYLKYNSIDKDELTDEEYKEHEAKCRSDFDATYDEVFFEETTYFNLALETLMSWADVSTLDERSAYPADK